MSVVAFSTSVDRKTIQGMVHFPSEATGLPWVVLNHGLASSMDSPKFHLLGEELCRRGIIAVRFDFRGCGSSEGDPRETTISGRLKDLAAVFGHMRGAFGLNGPVGLLGSSMGGYISLLTFAARNDIRAVCVWATPFDMKALAADRDDSDLEALGPRFYEDLGLHDLASLAPRLHHLLVLHGECDEVVPQDHARRLHRVASDPKALHIFPGGDHRFTDPEQRARAVEMSLHWFRTHMQAGR
jgi:uncharacterized protein